MASGQKRELINTRERAVSDDIVRLQDFVAAARAEIFRGLYNDVLGNFFVRPGTSYRYTALPPNAPLPADVYGGLEVIVDDAANLHVQPGILMAYTGPPASTDDSGYVIATDLNGVFTPGLTFVANAGPGVRIDVVECRPIDLLRESDSRDEYDEVTGLFTPAVVEKVRETDLEYRIRSGTPGAGPPGYDSAWLPLCVAIVQQGAADWTEVDFYDVRPLIAERSPVPTFEWPTDEFGGAVWSSTDDVEIQFNTAGADDFMRGSYRGQFNGYLIGGDLRRNTPSAVADFGSSSAPLGGEVDGLFPNEAVDQAAGFTYVGANLYALVALFPSLDSLNVDHQLPRWVRYSQTAAADVPTRRRPTGARGILVFTSVSGIEARGIKQNVNPPTLLGWTFPGWARVVAVGTVDASVPQVLWANADWHETQFVAHSHDSIGAGKLVFDLVPNVDYPANATRLLAVITVDSTATPGVGLNPSFTLEVQDTTNGSTQELRSQMQTEIVVPGSGALDFRDTYEIPLPPPPSGGATGTPVVTVRLAAANVGALVGGTMFITAWKMR